jgi:hypothetical protein
LCNSGNFRAGDTPAGGNHVGRDSPIAAADGPNHRAPATPLTTPTTTESKNRDGDGFFAAQSSEF